MDLKYAYSQINLQPRAAKLRDLNIVSGYVTGMYQSKTGLYEITDMPAEFQKAMKSGFPDTLLIVSKNSEEDHFKLVKDFLTKLDEDNFRINLPNCQFAKTIFSWLADNVIQSGIFPLE